MRPRDMIGCCGRECTEKKLLEIEALLEGAAKLHEANDFDHSIALIYVALDKIREIA